MESVIESWAGNAQYQVGKTPKQKLIIMWMIGRANERKMWYFLVNFIPIQQRRWLYFIYFTMSVIYLQKKVKKSNKVNSVVLQGPNGVQGYWLKNFTLLHSGHMKEFYLIHVCKQLKYLDAWRKNGHHLHSKILIKILLLQISINCDVLL